ncbi:hypothetical protein [Aliamphritea spongicola]|nr:hypothetical protein [Aliamphritea spongicola]
MQLVILDDYELNMKRRLTDALIVVFDDLASREIQADILIDASPVRQEADYKGLVSESCHCLIGSSYLMLERNLFTSGKKVKNRGHLFLGSTDPLNLTEKYLELLLDMFLGWQWEVVITSRNRNVRAIEELIKAKHNAFLSFEPSSLAEGLVAAEIAIGAPGLATWQRIAAGCQVALVATHKNQINILEELEREGLIKYLGYGFNKRTIEHKLRKFLVSEPVTGRLDLDADGAVRIKQKILSCLEGRAI